MAMRLAHRVLQSRPISSSFWITHSVSSFDHCSPLTHDTTNRYRQWHPSLLGFSSFHYLSGSRSLSTNQTSSSLNDPNPNWSNRPPKETILLDGCDFEHWLIVMEKPPEDWNRDQIIDHYIKTLALTVGSEEEARMKIYSVSTRCYFAFGALVSEEISYKIKELPNVRWVLPDSYLDVKNKDYGGEPFINGQAVPYDPKYHEEWIRNNAQAMMRNERNKRRGFDRRNRRDPPSQQSGGNLSFHNPPESNPSSGPGGTQYPYQSNRMATHVPQLHNPGGSPFPQEGSSSMPGGTQFGSQYPSQSNEVATHGPPYCGPPGSNMGSSSASGGMQLGSPYPSQSDYVATRVPRPCNPADHPVYPSQTNGVAPCVPAPHNPGQWAGTTSPPTTPIPQVNNGWAPLTQSGNTGQEWNQPYGGPHHHNKDYRPSSGN